VPIVEIPAFTDNIIWGLQRGDQLLVVDPGEAAPVLAHLQAHGLSLSGILITHHHADHVGGIQDLLAQAPLANIDIPVVGPAACVPHGVNRTVQEGDAVAFDGLDIHLSVMEVPGHTQDHIAYFGTMGASGPLLFCGDTLFAGGCGRLLGGTAAQLHQSLQRLKGLPAETAVHCAHEYTLGNLLFSAHVHPDHAAIQARLSEVRARRDKGQSTLPSRMAIERETNPFLWATDVSAFASLRAAKDVFRAA
jgi:hydroxyacylglutathione hydrolase